MESLWKDEEEGIQLSGSIQLLDIESFIARQLHCQQYVLFSSAYSSSSAKPYPRIRLDQANYIEQEGTQKKRNESHFLAKEKREGKNLCSSFMTFWKNLAKYGKPSLLFYSLYWIGETGTNLATREMSNLKMPEKLAEMY